MNLIPEADLVAFTVWLENTNELHGSINVKNASETKMVAVPLEVVPFVHINPIPLVGHNLLEECVHPTSSRH